jgi:hypothetical protein
VFIPAPSDGSTFADWDAEDRLVDELLASGVLDPDPEEQPCLPPDVEAWPADCCLAILLDHVDPMSLSDTDRVRYVVAAERLTAHTQATGFSGIGAVAGSYRSLDLDDAQVVADGVGFELESALRWTRRHAETELDLASDLLEQLPSVFRALSEGRIDRQRAKIIVDGTAHLQSIAHARQVAGDVLDDAARLTSGQLAGRVRRACLEADPDTVRKVEEQAKTERRFVSWTAPDGTMGIQVTGIDPVRGQELSDRINRIARELRGDGETRSMDQLRADVAVDLLTGTTSPAVGKIHLTVDLATLAGLADTPGDLAGYGPILADITRQLVEDGDGSWDWTVTHPDSGMPVADGHTKRRHTASQRRRLTVRHATCVAPGCRMPTIDCDLDHTTPYAASGITETDDSAPLCRHHHCVRHQTGWSYRHLPNGDILWTSPLGTTYTTSGRSP